MIFWRLMDNMLYPIQETNTLGFEKEEGLRIPDEYLETQKFMVMRTCHGIGDWGILSAMPRLLKEKYPNCKVYVPTKKLSEGKHILRVRRRTIQNQDTTYRNVATIPFWYFKN